MNIEENIVRGRLAIEEILQTHGEVKDAMERPETGAIDFLWGEEGTAERKHKDGFGIAKILLKHGMEAVIKIPDVIARGNMRNPPTAIVFTLFLDNTGQLSD